MRVSHLIAIALLVLGVLPQGTGPKLMEPPFVRKWTASVGDGIAVIAVQDGIVYYRCGEGVGAIDLATGQRRWSSLTNVAITAAALQGHCLYALAQVEVSTTLQVIDIASGQARMLASLPVDANLLTVDPERIYVLDYSGKLTAYHPSSGAVLWSCPFGPATPDGGFGAQLKATPDGIYVALSRQGEFGVAKQNGTILWSHKTPVTATLSLPNFLDPVITCGSDIITHNDGLQRIVMSTGKNVWKMPQRVDDVALIANVLIGIDEKEMQGRDVRTGKILWSRPVPEGGVAYDTREDLPPLSDGENVWLRRNPYVCVSKEGQVDWRRSAPFTGTPVYADPAMVVTVGSLCIFGYAAGTLPPLPTEPEKRALAERLTSQYEILDNAERKQLEKLTPYAFPLLAARFVEWGKAYQDSPTAKDRYRLGMLLSAVQSQLQTTYRDEDRPALMTAWANLGDHDRLRNLFERILMAKRDPNDYIPLFVEMFRKQTPQAHGVSLALSEIAHSSRPEAVAFMLEILRDPAADPEWRREAFVNLVHTGGQAGIQAVLAARHHREACKPWFDRIDLAQIAQIAQIARGGNLGVKEDAQGRTWMLFQSAVLGNRSDLFIVQKIGSGWGRPLFTGVWTRGVHQHNAPQTFRGIPIADLVSTQWIKIFPNDAAIRLDTDGDGLTDLVEARLGTDPTKADTDGDGLSDLVDPCPNAAPRPLGDTEKIVAACVEHLLFEADWGAPVILSVPGVRPFEMYGYGATLLWETPEKKIPLSELFGGGFDRISLAYPDTRVPLGQGVIKYSPDHKTARTLLWRQSGGLNGEEDGVSLRKIGDEWIVIDFRTLAVS